MVILCIKIGDVHLFIGYCLIPLDLRKSAQKSTKYIFQVRIHWPVEKCRLLGEEVVIIDSPGIDVDVDLDDWIDK